MKGFIKLAVVAGGLFFLASCDSATGVYNGNNGRVYRAPDGGVYRTGDIYTDRNGNVYRNGSIYKTKSYKRLPPGQAKKIYGGNARDYAPGHNKHKHHDHDKGPKKGPKHKGKHKH